MHGVTHGATLGGADEMGGLLTAIADKTWSKAHDWGITDQESPTQVAKRLRAEGIVGDVGPESFSEMYREGQQETKRSFDEAQERSPYLYGGGTIAGSLATGLGTGTALTKAGVSLGSKVALKEAAKQGGKALTKEVGKRAGKAALIAAPEGAIAGALGSEEGKLVDATPEEKQKLLADTLSGTLTASTLAGGISAASDLIPLGVKAGKESLTEMYEKFKADSPTLRQASIAREYGNKGINIGSEKQTLGTGSGEPGDALIRTETDAATDMVNKMIGVERILGEEMTSAIDDAVKAGTVVSIKGDLAEASKHITDYYQSNPIMMKNPKVNAILAKIMRTTQTGGSFRTPALTRTDISAEEAKTLINEMDNLASKLKRSSNSVERELGDVAVQMRQNINSSLGDAVPRYKQAAARYTKFLNNTTDNFLRGTTPDEFSDVWFNKVKNNQATLHRKVKNVVAGATRPSASGAEAQEVFSNVKTGFNKLNSSDEFADVMPKLGNFVDDLQHSADKSSMLQLGRHVDRTQGLTTPTGMISSTGRGALMFGANKFGLIEKPIKKALKSPVTAPVNLGKKLYNLTNDGYVQLAEKLNVDPKMSSLGKALQEAIQSNDMARRNAVLFSIMQNPNARMYLSSEDIGGDE
jgi:hypothetical protein